MRKFLFPIFKYLLKFLIIFTVPVIITMWIFPPWQKITLIHNVNDLGNKKEPLIISDIISGEQIVGISPKIFIADFIKIPLYLKMYDVTIVNKSYLKGNISTCWVIDQYPQLIVSFIEGNPERYSNISLQRTIPIEMRPDVKQYEIPFEKRSSFSYLSTDSFRIAVAGITMLGPGCSSDVSMEIDIEVYAEPNTLAWIVESLLVFVIWIIFLSSVISVWKFYFKKT